MLYPSLKSISIDRLVMLLGLVPVLVIGASATITTEYVLNNHVRLWGLARTYQVQSQPLNGSGYRYLGSAEFDRY